VKKKLTKHGNSAAIVIEKPILELLQIDFDTELEIQTDGQNLVISPIKKDQKQKKTELVKALEKVKQNHGQTLKKLAK
tara:strand:- start:387 stop:620 length:234 start_codon:yes stop_codon:yes gene_type:complete